VNRLDHTASAVRCGQGSVITLAYFHGLGLKVSISRTPSSWEEHLGTRNPSPAGPSARIGALPWRGDGGLTQRFGTAVGSRSGPEQGWSTLAWSVGERGQILAEGRSCASGKAGALVPWLLCR